MKKIPWLSLSLLFAAYTTFSWFISHATTTWLAWTIVLTFTLAQALLLTTFFIGVRKFFARWLRSDVGYFSLIIVGALSVTLALVWFQVFGYLLVVVTTEVLARLDLQNYRYNRYQAFLVLAIVSLAGLAAGWFATQNPTFRLPINLSTYSDAGY